MAGTSFGGVSNYANVSDPSKVLSIYAGPGVSGAGLTVGNVFSPLSLFAAGEQGAWYDPSDLTTLFQNVAGTTPVTAVEQVVGKMLDKSGRGNHAVAAADNTTRPTLRARYNLLTYSEQFDDAAWIKGAPIVTVTPNTAVAPNGTTTADSLFPTVGSNNHFMRNTAVTMVAGDRTFSVYAKYGNNRWLAIQTYDGASSWVASFDLLNGVVGTKTASATSSITSVGNGWYRLTITVTGMAGTVVNYIGLNDSDAATLRVWTAAGTEYAYLWGAQLVTGSLPGAYQRIAAATDYDSDPTKFPWYLDFDGSNDALSTASIDFSATDKVSVFAGVHKRKADSGQHGLVAETGSGGLQGSFMLFAPTETNRYLWSGSGSVYSPVTQAVSSTAATYNSPHTGVLTGTSNIAGDLNELRINGSSIGIKTGDLGTGNFGNYALNVGARAGNTLNFDGRIYSLIVRGAASTDSEIASTEAWVGVKTGLGIPGDYTLLLDDAGNQITDDSGNPIYTIYTVTPTV